RDSILTVGYSYHLLDDRENYSDEYDQHTPYINLTYRFHPQWLASVFYEYSKADYDDAGEEKVQDTGATLAYDVTLKDRLSASYGYQKTEYDAAGRVDYDEQNVDLSWSHNREFGQHMLLTSTLVADFVDRDIDSDERGLSLSLGLTRTIQRGSLSLSGEMGTDERDADGGWDKYQRNFSIAGGLNYQVLEDLTGNINASFEKRYDWDLAGDKSTFDDYGAGAGLTWSFSRWYQLSVTYSYDRLDAKDSLASSYFEHTVMVQLSAAKDLLKW
ncbi:MAG: outer membrane beta-barrel protein, partial [Desulfobulbaceae bacterium]|nr:outer membrane beta-barrel protein [Candidatus Desulfobia pelagia]